ncbi:MAG: phosphoribosylamine--glycine ligase [Candidatus Delongbacteria bacterium]|nr:MAG: phosphoribosylamine--glycine ligase [Candidatus Delongbacteria bacterium]
MNILLIGSGGREHALATAIAKSPLCKKLYIAPGNPGTAALGTNIDIDLSDFELLKKTSLEKQINMVVCGPEAPLAKGMADAFAQDEKTEKIKFIGPGKIGAKLESSKDFAKNFMQKYNIPTARYQSFKKHQLTEAQNFLNQMHPPYVIKADGLAAGKGVVITSNIEEAKSELKAMFDGKFGEAGTTIVIEEFLKGIEVSVFVITDGKEYILLPEAKDYKRIGENDTGLNTGGMGAISPVSFADDAFMNKVKKEIIEPTLLGLQQEKINYTGFIFFGLIKVDQQPYVIEYNVRMGDPETEVVLPRIKSDFVELLQSAADNTLSSYKIKISEKTAAAVILVSAGYPENYPKGEEIQLPTPPDECFILQMGTKQTQNKLITAGGRVLAVGAFGKDTHEALEKAYENVNKVNFKSKYYRKDIGFDL